MTKSKKSPAGVRFGVLERIDPPASGKNPAAGAPSVGKPVPLRRCPVCRLRPATEVVELTVVHVRVCTVCAGNAHTALRVFGVLKTLF